MELLGYVAIVGGSKSVVGFKISFAQVSLRVTVALLPAASGQDVVLSSSAPHLPTHTGMLPIIMIMDRMFEPVKESP